MRRRQFLTAASVAGFACLAVEPARALSLEPAPAAVAGHLRQTVPPVDGALDWELLARAGESRFQDGTISRFPAALRDLDGRSVTLTGYMMPFRDGAEHSEFLLGALQFHCPSCMAADLNRLVAVKAARPVAYADTPLVLRGTLRLLEDTQSPLFYRLDDARTA